MTMQKWCMDWDNKHEDRYKCVRMQLSKLYRRAAYLGLLSSASHAKRTADVERSARTWPRVLLTWIAWCVAVSWNSTVIDCSSSLLYCITTPTSFHTCITGAALDGKNASPSNLPPKMDAAFQGLITNAGLMAAGMSYSYSSQKQMTSLYVYIWRHWNGRESRLNSCVSQFKTSN